MYVLFDIGGTKTRVAISADLQTLAAVLKYDTPSQFEEGVRQLALKAKILLEGKPITLAAGGIRGPLSKEHDRILTDTVLTDWVEKPLLKSLEQALGAPVVLENDAALAGLGEVHFGSGRGHDIVAYYTVSTGVGGARIVHGTIDAASAGFEPGKQVIDLDATKEGGEADTLEEIISGEALEQRRGVKPYEIPQSDPVWEELARSLAFGLKNTVAFWSPDAIVLGGSMIVGDPRILLEPVRLHLGGLLKGLMPCPPVFDAKFRDEGGLYGAMVLARQHNERQVK